MSDIQREKETDEIWDRVREIAKEQVSKTAFSGIPTDLPSMNPYQEKDWRYGEWQAAHEHYIMTALGY